MIVLHLSDTTLIWLAIFATFRLALLFSKDLIFLGLRRAIGRRAAGSKAWKFLADLITCPYCLGVWFAALCTLMLLFHVGRWIILVFGLAGVQYAIWFFFEALASVGDE